MVEEVEVDDEVDDEVEVNDEVDDEVDDEVEDDEDDDENDDENDGFVGEEDCVTLLLVVFISTICLSSLIHGLQRRLR